MLTRKNQILILLITLCSTISLAFAGADDFCAHDLTKLLNGEKNMVNAQLDGANLKGKNLSNVNFTKAELEKANLSCSDLTNTNFTDADLEEANLKGANIKGANFKNAELEYAIWTDGRICAEGSVGGCW